MTEDEKRQAVKMASEGKTVGILCFDHKSAKHMCNRMMEVTKKHANGVRFKRVGDFISFPDFGGMIRIFVLTKANSHHKVFLDPQMTAIRDRIHGAFLSEIPNQPEGKKDDRSQQA